MSHQLAKNANESEKESIPRAGVLDSDPADQPAPPVSPYKPYAEEPAAPESYRPYTEKPAPSEHPYEPYKGI